jgi:hypothetical protein
VHKINAFVNEFISNLRRIKLSFILLQNCTHHNSQEIQQKKLLRRQDIQIHNSVKHVKQDFEVNYNSTHKQFNENSRHALRVVDERSQKQKLRNSIEVAH